MEAALRTISEGTAALTGLDFFRTVARLAAETLDSRYALVAEALGERKELVSTLAFWQGDAFGENVTYPLAGTPCEAVTPAKFVIIPAASRRSSLMITTSPHSAPRVTWGFHSSGRRAK